MNIKALVKELLKREGKKRQIDVAQMTETVSVLSDWVYESDPDRESSSAITSTLNALWLNGKRRAKKKK